MFSKSQRERERGSLDSRYDILASKVLEEDPGVEREAGLGVDMPQSP